jgi:hypothetical protein
MLKYDLSWSTESLKTQKGNDKPSIEEEHKKLFYNDLFLQLFIFKQIVIILLNLISRRLMFCYWWHVERRVCN